MPKVKLRTAEQVMKSVTKAQEAKIANLYAELAKEVKAAANDMPKDETVTKSIKKSYLNALQKRLKASSEEAMRKYESLVLKNMGMTAKATADDMTKWLKGVGLSIKGAMSHVPERAVRRVVTGQLYNAKWSLTKTIWGMDKKLHKDINVVVAKGLALNKSAYDIAKDLEQYVNPSARKPWAWSKVYPGTNKQVDYSAQRLARTMVSHTYQAAFVDVTKPNPWVTEYEWQSSGSRPCPICQERNGQRYSKDELPLDHPNGMCTYIAVVEQNMTSVANDIAEWYNSPEGEFPNIDEYADFLASS